MSACCGVTKQVKSSMAPPDPTKHVNYVRGMVLEVDEFTQEFAYLNGRDRWLAREAIGYGTLRGLALRWEKDKNDVLQPSVMVTSGVGLTPGGQLVCVSSNQCADINQWLAATERDAEISARLETANKLTLYVTLAYCDCETDSEPVPGEPCRSAADLMQPSRITDSFQLELSYEPPVQEEEDAVRGFSAWLGKIAIDPVADNSLDPDKFVAAVRAWNTSASDPASITIRAADAPDYFATALRLWVTELRVEAAAFQRFKLWLYSVPHKTDGSTKKEEFLAEVRRWSPSTCSWPSNLAIKTDDGVPFIAEAITLWDSEIAPKWYSEYSGCGAPVCADLIENRLLLGALNFSVVRNAGNSWAINFDAGTPSVDESQRPILGHLRMLQEQLVPTPEAGSQGPVSFSPLNVTPYRMNVTPYRIVALGRLSSAQPQTSPVVANTRIASVNDGEVRFKFDGYSKPDDGHDYVVHVIASFTGNKSEPAVRFVKFDDDDFLYKVTRSNKGVLKAELEKMEFQVEVTMIVKPN